MASADLMALRLEMSTSNGLNWARTPCGVCPHSVSSAASPAADLDCVIIVFKMDA